VTTAASSTPPHVPDHVLLRCIGQGSYGEVWLARSVVGTLRAVKVVYRSRFKEARPFEREFTGIQRFEPVSRLHEGFVDVLQLGRSEDGGYFYYVMELADDASGITGAEVHSYSPKTLCTEVRRRGRLPLSECLEIAFTLGAALGHLHKRGLIHRDIKPSNIIFVQGTAKLADIGLVADVAEAKSYVGTEGFIPPEGPGTPQSDVFSLGKVLYEISTGRDRNDFPELPESFGSSDDEARWFEFNAILLRACESDPARRYPNADELLADLALLQSGRSVKRLRIVERRLRQVTRLGAVTALIALLAAGAYLAAQLQANHSERLRNAAEEQRRRAERAERDAKEKLRASYIAHARTLRASGRAGRRTEALESIRKATELGVSDELRNEAIAALAASDLRVAGQWRGYKPGSQRVLFDHDISVRAEADDRGQIVLRKLVDDSVAATLPAHGTGVDALLCFSANGRYLAVFYEDLTLRVWDVAESRVVWSTRARDRVVTVDFTPDSAHVVFVPGNRTMTWRSLGAENERKLRLPIVGHYFVFSPDGTRFAVGDGGTNVYLLAADTGEVVSELGHPGKTRGLAWSHDGERLAVGGNDSKVYVWNGASGELMNTLAAHSSPVIEVAFRPGSSLLASTSWDGTTRMWDLAREKVVLTYADAGRDLFFTPDGKRLRLTSFQGEHATILEVVESDVVRELREPAHPEQNGPWSVAFAGGGRTLLAGSSGGLRCWDVETGELMQAVDAAGWVTTLLPTSTNTLITCGGKGLLLWKLDEAGRVLGTAPERLSKAESYPHATLNERAGILAYAHLDHVHVRRPTGEWRLEPGFTPSALEVSQDGLWLAVSSVNGDATWLYSLVSTQRIHVLPAAGRHLPFFTPDGAGVVIASGAEYAFHDLGTGGVLKRLAREKASALHGRMAFAGVGALAAVARSRTAAQLIDWRGGRELAVLEHPEPEIISALAFSPDESLLAVATENHVVQLWNLKRLRERLAELGLDWEFGRPASSQR
jgi:WD40 repeat protein